LHELSNWRHTPIRHQLIGRSSPIKVISRECGKNGPLSLEEISVLFDHPHQDEIELGSGSDGENRYGLGTVDNDRESDSDKAELHHLDTKV
jgi:hypothetical protein